ncbi:MAG: hypothetical protein K6U87_10275 [Firmicutes bacterium]|nr:hypothetical protein [Bacillota bacterium]
MRYSLTLQAQPSPIDRRFRDARRVQDLTTLPTTCTLADWLGIVRDQNVPGYGECSGESGAGAMDWLCRRYRQEVFTGSSLGLYQVERALVGEEAQDAGARLRQTQIAMQTVGVWSDRLDPDTREDFVVRITPEMLADAARHRIREGLWCPSLEEILSAMADPDEPVVVQAGIVVYPGFEAPETLRTGAIPMPRPEEQPLGGHAILLYGYSIPDQVVFFRNSWGTGFGQGGNGTLPFAYFRSPMTFLSARAYYLAPQEA